jgi:hypothetical protein
VTVDLDDLSRRVEELEPGSRTVVDDARAVCTAADALIKKHTATATALRTLVYNELPREMWFRESAAVDNLQDAFIVQFDKIKTFVSNAAARARAAQQADYDGPYSPGDERE